MSDRQANPYVFVVGCPRSGTTLLQRMLDNHPELVVANDTHFITRAAKKELRKSTDPELTSELIDKVRNYHRFQRMGLSDSDVMQAAQGVRRYSEFVSGLYHLRAEKVKKSLSGEKTPDYCRKVPQLNALFPNAKFVHIIRDGRDTALSALKWATKGKGPGRWELWGKDPWACCALWWCWQAGSGVREGRKLLVNRYFEVQYEALVANPTGNLTALAGYLDISDSKEMSRYFEGKTRNNPNRSAKAAWLPPTPGLRNWRETVGQEDLAVFEAIAGELLQNLNYELSGAELTQAGMERVAQARAWWRVQPMSA
ncbi:MAG: hypothetical protein ACI9H8_001474 [Lysobacterales bacterium]|jgi:hypothetical protein